MKVAKWICVLIVSLLITENKTIIQAQENELITHQDCQTAFPTCKVYIPPTFGLNATFDPGQVQVSIDAQPLAVSSVISEQIGVQIAFSLDEFVVPGNPNADIRRAGQSGQPMFVEFRDSAIDLFSFLENRVVENQSVAEQNAEKQTLIEFTWLSAFRTGEPAEGTTVINDFPPIIDWVPKSQHNAFFNELIEYSPDENKNTPETPLFGLINATLNAFSSPTVPEDVPAHIARHAIIFTDGFERGLDVGLDDLIGQARENDIRLHTIKLGQWANRTQDAELASTLQNLSRPTGGQFVQYTSTDDLQPIWEQIARDISQTVITFPYPSCSECQLELKLGNLSTNVPLEAPPFLAPAVTIDQPPQGIELDWQAAAGSSAPEDQTLDVQIEITLPDGLGTTEERIESVEYTIGNITRLQKEVPLNQIVIPIGALETGEYTLSVRVKDRFTGIAEAEPLSLRINVVQPTATPLPEPTATPQTAADDTDGASSAVSPAATELPQSDPVTNTQPGANSPSILEDPVAFLGQMVATVRGIGLLALIPVGVLVLLLLFWFFRPRRHSQADLSFSSDPPNYSDVTEPDDATEPANDAFPMAVLVLVRGEGELPRTLSLYRQSDDHHLPNRWTIGRSYQESDVVIDSKRVSRLHATISEENEQYQIRDEGSSGGTFITAGRARVRQRLEPLRNVPLNDKDIINFNSVAYQFEIEQNDMLSAATEPEAPLMAQ